MKLLISQIADGENRLGFNSVRDVLVKKLMEEIEKSDEGLRFSGPLQVDLNLTKLEPEYYLRGSLACEISQNCARCAEANPFAVKFPFELGLAHIVHQKAKDPALTQESDVLDIIYFEGPELDLAPILEEQFFLGRPYQLVCKESCQGLCQQCGANRNIEPCDCTQSMGLSPFSVLKQLKH